jgi:hypothetical protein
MIEQDPKIVDSPLSRRVTKDGITVEVSIIRLEQESEWSLEVIMPPTRPSSGMIFFRLMKLRLPSSNEPWQKKA